MELLPLRDLLDVAWVLWVDGYNGWVDPAEVHEKLQAAQRQMWPDRATWDDDSPEEAAPRAMMEAQATRLSDDERDRLRRERDERRATRDG